MQCSKSPVAVKTCVSSHAPAQIRTCGFLTYGSRLGCVTANACRIRSSACDTRAWFSVQYVLCCAYSPWPPPFAPPTPLRPPPQTPPQWASFALFAGFTATMTSSDFSCPCAPCGPSLSLDADGQTRDLPVRCDPFARDVAFGPRQGGSTSTCGPHFPRENVMKPSLFGIRTFGSVWALIVSFSPMTPLSCNK
jgi:hypothetical protein